MPTQLMRFADTYNDEKFIEYCVGLGHLIAFTVIAINNSDLQTDFLVVKFFKQGTEHYPQFFLNKKLLHPDVSHYDYEVRVQAKRTIRIPINFTFKSKDDRISFSVKNSSGERAIFPIFMWEWR